MSTPKSFTLVLLYDKMAASLPVAQALKEKNIEIHVAQNAGELIQFVATKNVDLVGLSANHASSKSLIQVLREKTIVKILIFGEDKSLGTADRVDKLDGDYKVQGVATAYNIWMKIATLVKNKMKESENNGNILYSGNQRPTNKQDSAIIIKNSKEDSVGKVERSSFGKKKKDKNKKQSGIAERDDKSDVMNFQDPAAIGAKKESSNAMLFKKDSTENKKSKKKNKGFGSKAATEEDQSPSDPLSARKDAKQGGDAVADEMQAEMEASNGNLGNIIEVGMQESEPAETTIAAPSLSKKSKKFGKQEPTRSAAPEIPFKDQVMAAANGAFVSHTDTPETFGAINRMTVVPVDKESGRGFLIFCTKDNQFMGSSGGSFDTFQTAFIEKMSQQDAVSVGEVYHIETEEIELAALVATNCDFHVVVEDPKSQKQILICFVARENIYPDTNKSGHTNMLQIELNVIPAETPISFNLFLHFARSNKMIPYLRRGGELTPDQVQRLTQGGVQSVYIPEEERKALYSFFISQTIHQDIRPTKKAA